MTAHAGHVRPARTGHAERAARARKADRAARHAFRSRRVRMATLAAVLLTAAAVLTAIEVITGLLDRPWHLIPYERVSDVAWNDAKALGITAALAVLGLLFLLAGLLPGRTRMVPLQGDDPDIMMGVNRRGLKRAAAAAAEDAPGVSRVRKVKLGRRKVRVRAETPVHDPAGLGLGVATSVQDRLDRLRPFPPRAVKVRLRAEDD
ncbi:DUF6286 domain-containing protein [Actinomadura sp. WMMB 499]|uniref:DUF6286 domain-containing protein n=1 Tax=Actinomadura sp. WMMB 499 TaxID=1219491 RepID=UPI001244FD76|nr:DUF6286 domain-containing protein [Actinomadura sp. WMMB 499]QFG24346.1 hypothetical protein F7P10_27660 [Actinomadura sp. WMMB 499]